MNFLDKKAEKVSQLKQELLSLKEYKNVIKAEIVEYTVDEIYTVRYFELVVERKKGLRDTYIFILESTKRAVGGLTPLTKHIYSSFKNVYEIHYLCDYKDDDLYRLYKLRKNNSDLINEGTNIGFMLDEVAKFVE